MAIAPWCSGKEPRCASSRATIGTPGYRIAFYAFDALQIDGHDLMREPLLTRRARLLELIGADPVIRYLHELPGSAADIVRVVRAAGIEGVVAKRRDSAYKPAERSSDWRKFKLERQQELVIGGFRPDGSVGIDALLVGYYEGDTLQFAGKVRAGFTPHIQRELLRKLTPLGVPVCPFANLPDANPERWGGGVTADQMTQIRWTRPELVAQVRFVEWTAEARLRHAAFLGLRIDKAPREVRRES